MSGKKPPPPPPGEMPLRKINLGEKSPPEIFPEEKRTRGTPRIFGPTLHRSEYVHYGCINRQILLNVLRVFQTIMGRIARPVLVISNYYRIDMATTSGPKYFLSEN